MFDIGLHTVIILVGPSQSGKSTWAELFQKKIKSIDPTLRVNHLSTDVIRQQLLGEKLDRYDPKMMEASEAAFDLLFHQLDASIRYPINQEFVIIDSTGLDFDFRKRISEKAKEHGYRTAIVVFDYPTSQYFDGLDAQAKIIVGRHVDTFKKQVLPKIQRKYYDYSLTVREKSSKYFQDLDLNVIDYALWKKTSLDQYFDTTRPIAFIGDTHEHVLALKELISKLSTDCQFVFLGDYLDKGSNTLEMIDYMDELVQKGAIIIKANHESFVYRRFKGQIEQIHNEDELFPSYKVLTQYPQYQEKFFKLFENSLPFGKLSSYGKTIYATHSPCLNKSIGKLSEKEQKNQRNFHFNSRENEHMINELSFVEKEAKFSHPIHIFGHVAHKFKKMDYENKIWLDTGAVYGGKLSAYVVFPDGKHKFISVNATSLVSGNLLYYPKKVEKSIDNNKITHELENKNEIVSNSKEDIVQLLSNKYNLSSEDKHWLYSFYESGAKYVSGTMSPSAASDNKLEPIDTALEYFKKRGVEQVILQPKYMGSRLQLYLHKKQPQLDFAITRNGNLASISKNISLISTKWHERLDNMDFWNDIIILDGELLPWSSIAQDLIDKEFKQYGVSVQTEIENLISDPVFSQFNNIIHLEQEHKGVNIFNEQLAIFGANAPIEYKPFSILSVDGKSWISEDQAKIFSLLMPEEKHLIINLNQNEFLSHAHEFFDLMTDNLSYEGLVVKPLLYKKGVAPYIKVRQEKYLHLIYGHDYKLNYEKKLKQKRIEKKLGLSINEFELGLKMLEAKNQEQLLDLACQIRFEINQEITLDPKL
jgi:predicted kinase